VGSDLGLFCFFFLGVFFGLMVGLPMYTLRRFALFLTYYITYQKKKYHVNVPIKLHSKI
jgi:hypothetical protein